MTTITITGPGAAAIEKANEASFYGIFKSFMPTPETIAGNIAANEAVTKWLNENHPDWNSFLLVAARTIDTSGTKTPYKAEIDFKFD